jgi:hypothetical protein
MHLKEENRKKDFKFVAIGTEVGKNRILLRPNSKAIF